MSYCRFSSDNFKSDVYVYENIIGGYTIHVAQSRVIGDVPKIPNLIEASLNDYMEAYTKQTEFMKTADYENIGLKYDGKTFNIDSATECAEKLIELRKEGYHIPDGVIDILVNEINILKS
jgi:hypothetical protein